MCGIAGIIKHNPSEIPELQKMLTCIKHRGPDDEGMWYSKSGRAGLGQRRLSIIDLSPGGHQPMISESGRYVMTYNGELYNYRELKAELQSAGHTFKSESDSEVLLKAHEVWGAQEALAKLNGMFAYAVWDEKEQELFAARDLLGEKPFKYYEGKNELVFASELKAILEYPGVPRDVDWQAVDLAMTYRYVPAPQTGFAAIKKLPAGYYLTWKDGAVETAPYWQAADYAKENHTRSLSEWKTQLWDGFKDSIEHRMISDVPVGAFLSGGLDSSSVVAAMSEIIPGEVRTFSVGFKDDKYGSEVPYARAVAEHFKTKHTEIVIEPNVIEMLPELAYQYEEPFFDNAAVPTMAMSKLTKEHVTVVLTGDGADELFAGYTNHSFYKQLASFHKLPKAVRTRLIPGIANMLAKTGNPKMAKLFYRTEMLSGSLVQAYTDYYAIWKKSLPRSKYYLSKDDLYTSEMKAAINIGRSEELMHGWLGFDTVADYGPINRALLADSVGRLSDDYLMKVDFAAMRYALETRAPFLDHNFVELAMSIPDHFKQRDGDVKWIWKQIVQDKLPQVTVKRKKAGFGIPIGEWMKHELYDYVREQLIGDGQILYDKFDRTVIEQLITDHKAGKADYSNHIWCLLNTKLWLQSYQQ